MNQGYDQYGNPSVRQQPGRILTVSNVNSYIKAVLTGDRYLSSLCIKGEISNFKLHSSGHAYFSLKDNNSVIRCVMFASRFSRVRFTPKDGMGVIVSGSISVYEKDGSYQLYGERMEPDGLGALYMAFEELKKKLYLEGLFDERAKKPIPFLPKKIGVITSDTGAVLHDIQTVAYRRFPMMNMVVIPVNVQGREASGQIARALMYADHNCLCDVIILARGGGSIEDLWPFNEEVTARAIAACRIPVISAIGHETDYTIADLVSDRRAPTPSAAAEIAVPEFNSLKMALEGYLGKMKQLPAMNIALKRSAVARLKENVFFMRPFETVNNRRMNVTSLEQHLQSVMDKNLKELRQKTEIMKVQLKGLNPDNILQRGYSIVYDREGKVVCSGEQVSKDDELNIKLKNGKIDCRVV